jgi:hypothetical protein
LLFCRPDCVSTLARKRGAVNYTEVERRLSAQMMTYWANFAKTGYSILDLLVLSSLRDCYHSSLSL